MIQQTLRLDHVEDFAEENFTVGLFFVKLVFGTVENNLRKGESDPFLAFYFFSTIFSKAVLPLVIRT